MDESIQKTSTRSDFMRDLQSMLHEGEAMLKNAGRHLRQEYRSVRERGNSGMAPSAGEISRGLRTADDSLFARTCSAGRSAGHFVQDHPWQAAAVGTCVGVVVGILMARK